MAQLGFKSKPCALLTVPCSLPQRVPNRLPPDLLPFHSVHDMLCACFEEYCAHIHTHAHLCSDLRGHTLILSMGRLLGGGVGMNPGVEGRGQTPPPHLRRPCSQRGNKVFPLAPTSAVHSLQISKMTLQPGLLFSTPLQPLVCSLPPAVCFLPSATDIALCSLCSFAPPAPPHQLPT